MSKNIILYTYIIVINSYFVFVSVLGPYFALHGLFTEGLFLVLLTGPFGVLGNEPIEPVSCVQSKCLACYLNSSDLPF